MAVVLLVPVVAGVVILSRDAVLTAVIPVFTVVAFPVVTVFPVVTIFPVVAVFPVVDEVEQGSFHGCKLQPRHDVPPPPHTVHTSRGSAHSQESIPLTEQLLLSPHTMSSTFPYTEDFEKYAMESL